MSEKQKIGAAHAAAMGRQGLKELAQALPAFPSSGVQPVEEPGLAGNLTPQEVAQGKTDWGQKLSGGAQVQPQPQQEMER